MMKPATAFLFLADVVVIVMSFTAPARSLDVDVGVGLIVCTVGHAIVAAIREAKR